MLILMGARYSPVYSPNFDQVRDTAYYCREQTAGTGVRAREQYLLITSSRGEEVTRWGEAAVIHSTFMTMESVEQLPLPHIPDLQCGVQAGSEQEVSAWMPGHTRDSTVVSRIALNQLVRSAFMNRSLC